MQRTEGRYSEPQTCSLMQWVSIHWLSKQINKFQPYRAQISALSTLTHLQKKEEPITHMAPNRLHFGGLGHRYREVQASWNEREVGMHILKDKIMLYWRINYYLGLHPSSLCLSPCNWNIAFWLTPYKYFAAHVCSCTNPSAKGIFLRQETKWEKYCEDIQKMCYNWSIFFSSA